MFSKKILSGVALTALSVALAGPAAAQETTSAVRGEVTTTDGQPLGGAQVVVTHVPTGTRSSEGTDAGGLFDLRGLRVGGPYTIEVTADDFQGERVENVFLQIGTPFRITMDLEPSDEGIVVVGTSIGVTNAVGSNSVLNRDDIEGVVSINRDIRDLARRDPLVSQNSRGDGGISIAGSNPRTNRVAIDGVQAQDDFGLNTGGLPTRRGPVSLDAVRQFSVEAVPFDVENGDFIGGAINIVLAEGGNEFEGSVFVNYLNEGLVGTTIRGQRIDNTIVQENYGATLRGPILQDRLFFALSYETYESVNPTSIGPVGGGFASGIVGPTGAPNSLTVADIAAVTNVFASGYGSTFPFGAITLTKPVTDEKYTGRFDWNINEDHVASLTFRHSESSETQASRTNLSATSAGLDSQWYITGEDDYTTSLQINSDWSDALSTELRISTRDYTRLQEPPAGQDFADIRVCSTATSAADTGAANPTTSCRFGASTTVAAVRFGPDNFRHANFLHTENRQAQFSAEYQWGAHLFKAGVQYQNTDVFNVFVQDSDGVYYFDSIADFAAGRANELVYGNALTGDPNDAAAIFNYDVYTIFAQDTWDLTDKLTVNYGLRYDDYVMDDRPARNQNFVNRYGYTNQENYNGIQVLMPRFSFTYDPLENVRVSGGIGLFSGGIPDVFLSNPFSVTGILTNSLTFQRHLATDTQFNAARSLPVGGGLFITETSGSVNCVTTPVVCTDALNVPVNSSFGQDVPTSIQTALGGSTPAPLSIVNNLTPDFDMPSVWKSNISISWDFLDDWRAGFDFVGIQDEVALAYRDIRAQPLIINGQRALTPDGRLRYFGLSTTQIAAAPAGTVITQPSGTPTSGVDAATARSGNRDLEAFNPDETPFSWIVSFSLGKEWDNGVSASVAYTYQDLEEFSASARFSSTASSLYGGQYASIDPNTAITGRSQEEIENAFKYNFSWRHNFLEELETRFTLFGEWRSGRPLTFTMNPGAGRNAVLGVSRASQLAYIPDMSGTLTQTGGTATPANLTDDTFLLSSDPLVSFDSVATFNNLTALIDRFSIPQGGIVPRGSADNPDINRLDLQISQELPVFFERHRARFTIDIGNVLNLIDDDWGVIEEYGGGFDNITLYNAACAGADGVADNDGAVTCNRYRLSSSPTLATATTKQRNTDLSRWTIQLGLRYEF